MARRDKAALWRALIERLEEALATARAAHAAAVEGATHDDARPENDKDTRGLEQSYLARGHAQRVAELEAGLAAVAATAVPRFGADAAVAAGALVTVDDDDRTRCFLVAAHGGGLVLPGDVTVVTPGSPLGRALLGRQVDDDVEVGARTLTITAIE